VGTDLSVLMQLVHPKNVQITGNAGISMVAMVTNVGLHHHLRTGAKGLVVSLVSVQLSTSNVSNTNQTTTLADAFQTCANLTWTVGIG
jgi:hypothetical protein